MGQVSLADFIDNAINKVRYLSQFCLHYNDLYDTIITR